jgi:acetolactate synthase-1/2/3 large subunit
MTIQTVGQAIVEALVTEQVTHVFGLAGSHILGIYDALIDTPSIRHITVKHENNAALMADMYGRLTRRPGVCLVTAGPGAMNSLPGIGQAFVHASPVIHISGSVPRRANMETLHGADDADFTRCMFDPVTKWSVRPESAAEIPEIIARAFAVALEGRPGPVHIEIPWDLLQADAQELPPFRSHTPQRVAPDPVGLNQIADKLRQAKRPLLAADKGVVRAGAEAMLVHLAERLAAPVVVTRDAIGAIPSSHPLQAGTLSLFATDPSVFQTMKKSDLVVAVGFRTGTENIALLNKSVASDLVCIALDDTHRPNPRASITLTADNALALQALTSILEGVSAPSEDIAQELARNRRLVQEGLKRSISAFRTTRPIHFGWAMHELAPYVGNDTIVVCDVGNHGVWARTFLPVHAFYSQPQPGAWAEMGFALPGAIAAKLVYPDKTVIGVTGDGSFLMSCGDFATAVEARTPIVLIILNDGNYGMITMMQRHQFGREGYSLIRSPNFAALAASFGAKGLRVEDPADLPDAYAEALHHQGPTIIDVVAGSTYAYPDYGAILQGK